MGQYDLGKVEAKNLAFLEKELKSINIVMTPSDAEELLTQLGDKSVALDFETTGLDPANSRVRLSCIYHPDHGVHLIDHMFAGKFNTMAKKMTGPMWLVYNAKFENRWFEHALGYKTSVAMMDVDFLAKSKQGGYPSSLARMARRDLKLTLSKEQQLSDWSKEELSTSQITYAATDAIINYMLYTYWLSKADTKQVAASWTMQDSVSAICECEDTGMTLDVDVHEVNIEKWKMKQALMYRRLCKWTPPSILKNPGSDKQVSDFLKTQLTPASIADWPKTDKTKQLVLNRKVFAPVAAKSPYPLSRWMNALIRFRYYRKYLSTYGETLLTKQFVGDKIDYRLNIGQAATIRMSSSNINIQNIPRAPWVRRAFLPPVDYDKLVVADYSGIEVRVLAELSQDKQLLQDCIYGDVHAASASAIYKVDEEEYNAILHDDSNALQGLYKERRTRAKGFTFQNIYGAAAGALSITLSCSVAEADAALRAWAKRYPKAYNYRFQMFDQMSRTGYIPCVDGRTIFVYKSDRTMPVAANYGVQSAAASVIYRAMYHVQRLRNERSDRNLIRLVATVHDEVILASMDHCTDKASEILRDGMTQGYLDVFPKANIDNLLEVGVGLNWGDAK